MKVDIFNLNKKYDIVYSDPPWQQTTGGKKKARPNSSGKPLNYPTMSLQDIKELHKNVFDNLTNKKHNVFMWTTEKFLHQTENFMSELGYKLHIRFVWSKGRGQSPAFTVRFTHEYLLWFYKSGDIILPIKEKQGKYSSVIFASSRKHSQKPTIVYEMLESMFPNTKRIELFARNHRENWDCWGNEAPEIEDIKGA